MLINVLVSLINLIIKALGSIASAALSLLPPSPFKLLDSINIPYLEYINWIIPISFMVNVIYYWLGAIALYYVVQVILRWIKVIR